MKNKNNKKSFAQLAKEIQKKYSRASFDPIEADALEAELEELMQLQEAERERLGLNQQEQMKNGGKMTYPVGGVLPSDFAIKSAVDINKKYSPIPSEFETKSAVVLGPILRNENKQIPLSTNLIGISPGNTEVTISGAGNPYFSGYGTPNLMLQPNDSTLMNPTFNRVDYKGLAYANQASNKAAQKDIANDILYPSNSFAPRLDKITDNLKYPKKGLPDVLTTNKQQGWTPQGIGDIIDLPQNTNIVKGGGRRLADINKLNSQIPQTTTSSKKTNTSNTNTTTPVTKIAANQYDPNSRLVTNTAKMQSQAAPKLNKEITPYQMKVLGANEMNKLRNRKLNQPEQEQSWWDKNKQYAPYAISGLSNIAGNLILANMAKKNQPTFTPATAVPEKINLEPQAEQLRKNASVAKNVALRNARNLGTNVGETLANMGNIGAAVDRGLGENLTNLYLGQEQANVGTANQFNLTNAEMQNRGNLINTQLKAQTLQDQLGYLSGALGTIPGVTKDIRLDKADKEMRDIMKGYYKNIGGRHYNTMGDLFNDPEAFQYYVKALQAKKKNN